MDFPLPLEITLHYEVGSINAPIVVIGALPPSNLPFVWTLSPPSKDVVIMALIVPDFVD